MSDEAIVRENPTMSVVERLRRWGILPRPIREADLCVLALALFAFSAFLPNFRSMILQALFPASPVGPSAGIDVRILIAVVALYATAIVACSAAFTRTKLGKFQRFSIKLFFTLAHVLVSGGMGYYLYAIDRSSPVGLLLGAWQLLQASVLLAILRRRKYDHYLVLGERQVHASELALGASLVSGIVWWARSADVYWAVTFSALLFAWSVIDSALVSATRHSRSYAAPVPDDASREDT